MIPDGLSSVLYLQNFLKLSRARNPVTLSRLPSEPQFVYEIRATENFLLGIKVAIGDVSRDS